MTEEQRDHAHRPGGREHLEVLARTGQRPRVLFVSSGLTAWLLTPPGTISIGGVQTGVQCLAGPSGWHLLGQTAVRTYQLHRDPTFLLEPGDQVTFAAVDAKTFVEQDRAAEAGEIVAELMAP